MDKCFWTGVGSRPKNLPNSRIEVEMMYVGRLMAEKGWILRSGNADGSDLAFQKGVYSVDPQLTEIFLPREGFNSYHNHAGAKYKLLHHEDIEACKPFLEKANMSKEVERMSAWNKAFHYRNVCQVTGKEKYCGFDLSNFVVYCAPEEDGVVSGGTRTAVYVARSLAIPTFNIGFPDQYEEFLGFISEL